jgi:hypothetical protein
MRRIQYATNIIGKTIIRNLNLHSCSFLLKKSKNSGYGISLKPYLWAISVYKRILAIKSKFICKKMKKRGF